MAPIPDDWNFDYANKVISHIDGILTHSGGTGTGPVAGDYIIQATSGAIGKVLSITGDETGGTLALTNVIGLFDSSSALSILSILPFDSVANSGFKAGDTIDDSSSGTMDVKFVEYNLGATAGEGVAYGDTFTVWSGIATVDITTGQAGVATSTGTGTDNDAIWTGSPVTTATLAVPGTANTNNSVIIHYDAGTISIPEDAPIKSSGTTANGVAQAIYGDITTGSVRIVDSDTSSGAWTDGNTIDIQEVIFYDTLVSGKVFAAGDVIKGTVNSYEARIIAVIDDGDDTGTLITAGNTGSPWTATTEDIQVLQSDDTYVTYATVESATDELSVATVKLDVAVRDEQRADQGGIYAPGSLNIVRSFNSFYSLNMDNFDELSQLDDDPALDGDVRDQLYTVLNDYIIPDLSFRFLEKGAAKDSGNNNLYVNLQSAGVLADVGNHGFEPSSTNPTPRPDMYVEQNSVVNRQDWIEGPIDILVKVKTKNDPKFINPNVEALGQLINGGTVALHVRPYRRTYDSAEITAPAGGQQAIFLSNAADLNNTTAQYSATVSGGSGTWIVGEEGVVASTGERVVCMSAVGGAAGPFIWANKVAGNNLVNSDVVDGVVSGAQSTINTVSDVVAGYGTDIRVMVIQRKFTENVAPSTAFVLGELVTQTTSGATGYFMEYDSTTGDVYIEEESGAFNGIDILTGANTGCTYDPATTVEWGDVSASEFVPKDIGGGVGDKDYTAVVSADITQTTSGTPVDPQSVQKIYEWWKFNLARESTYQVNTPNGLFSDYTEGRIHRRLDSTYAETRGASSFGLKAGTLVVGAQAVYIERLTLITADVRSIQLVAADGVTYDPPNVQTLETVGLTAGVAAAAYRSDGAQSTVILRNEFDVGTVGGGNNQSADSTVLVGDGNGGGGRTGVPTPNDVPDTGVLRILDPNDTGNYLRFLYTSVDRSTGIFTLSATVGSVTGSQDLTADDDVHVVFYEEVSGGASVSNQIQHTGADIDIVAVARIKGKKPFETTGVFGPTGLSIGANLITDPVVNLP